MWKKISTKKLFEHPWLTVEEDIVELQSGKQINYLRYGSGSDGVVIVAQNDQKEILFNREYSYVPNRILLQLPMGKIESGEDPEDAGNRELREETGFKARDLRIKGTYFQSHRRSTRRGIVLLASQLEKSALREDLEEEGAIENIWVPIDDINSLIARGEIIDTDTLSSLRICGL